MDCRPADLLPDPESVLDGVRGVPGGEGLEELRGLVDRTTAEGKASVSLRVEGGVSRFIKEFRSEVKKRGEPVASEIAGVFVEKVIDIRRTNSSQLSGFTKGRDLAFFLRRCAGIEYEHVPDFAPSEELLREYRARLGHKKKDDAAWQMYVERYEAEIGARLSGEDRLGFGSRGDRGGNDERNERMSYRKGEIVEVASWL